MVNLPPRPDLAVGHYAIQPREALEAYVKSYMAFSPTLGFALITKSQNCKHATVLLYTDHRSVTSAVRGSSEFTYCSRSAFKMLSTTWQNPCGHLFAFSALPQIASAAMKDIWSILSQWWFEDPRSCEPQPHHNLHNAFYDCSSSSNLKNARFRKNMNSIFFDFFRILENSMHLLKWEPIPILE